RQDGHRLGPRGCRVFLHGKEGELHGLPRFLYRDGARGGDSGAVRDRISAAGEGYGGNDRGLPLLGGVLGERLRMDSGGCVGGVEESGEKGIFFRGARREPGAVYAREGY